MKNQLKLHRWSPVGILIILEVLYKNLLYMKDIICHPKTEQLGFNYLCPYISNETNYVSAK